MSMSNTLQTSVSPGRVRTTGRPLLIWFSVMSRFGPTTPQLRCQLFPFRGTVLSPRLSLALCWAQAHRILPVPFPSPRFGETV